METQTIERQAVYVTEKKERINRIKEKYNNMKMSDHTAEKIHKLEITNNILKGATVLAGLVTVVDYFIPDPVPFLDEAVLSGLTTLLGSISTIVNNKIDSLAQTGSADVNMEEVQTIVEQMKNIKPKYNPKTK